MYDCDAVCENCHRPIDLSEEHITIAQNIESLDGDEVVVSDSTELACFCSQECCEEALGRLPFHAPR